MSALQNIPLKTIEGRPASLKDYQGQVALVVNTASKCGLTPQYQGLQDLYRRLHPRGFVVLGFPSNDFAGQEPGSDADIATFCSTQYSVDFPLFAKIPVVGAHKHPLYAALTAQQPRAQGSEPFREQLKGYHVTPNPEPEVLWNFEKFLISRSGEAVARFSPAMAPDDPKVLAAIEQELQRR